MADFASIFGAPKNLCLTPSPLPVCKGGTGEILTNRCPWGGSAGWCAQTAPTLLLPLPTARICVRQVQLIHSLVRLIVFFAQQGGRVFSFSMSLKKQGISFRLFCRVLGVAPHVRSPKDYVRAQFSGFRLRYFLNFSTKMLNLKPENSASTMGFSELTM